MDEKPAINKRGCEYCGEWLQYVGFDSNIDTITEEWWCDNCKEFLYFDEPGLRATEAAATGDPAGE